MTHVSGFGREWQGPGESNRRIAAHPTNHRATKRPRARARNEGEDSMQTSVEDEAIADAVEHCECDVVAVPVSDGGEE